MAEADASKVIELKPDDPSAYQIRGFANAGLQQWDKAIADFTVAIERNPNDWQNYDQRALAYRKSRDYEHAIADYNVAIEKTRTFRPPASGRKPWSTLAAVTPTARCSSTTKRFPISKWR